MSKPDYYIHFFHFEADFELMDAKLMSLDRFSLICEESNVK